jgi:hypothetical protein
MSVKKGSGVKAPSQNPTAFYKGQQQGGATGKPSSVPQKLSGGPMRERMMGKGK